MYANRAGVHVNRPTVISLLKAKSGDKRFLGHLEALQSTEEQGVPTLLLRPEVTSKIHDAVPDIFGLSESNMSKYGPYARYYKCKGVIERGAPCDEQKFNNNICPDRKQKQFWHPGWREMAMTGNLLALFLTETLIDALQNLIELNYDDPYALYAELKLQEDKEYASFLQSPAPAHLEGLLSEHYPKLGVEDGPLFRNKAVCKTALLPSQTRYLGILTESELKGELHGYDTGIESSKVTKRNSKKGEFVLVYNQIERQVCEVDLNVDYRDYFLATNDFGWASLTLPNDAELEAYAPSGFNPAGLVIICLMSCGFAPCTSEFYGQKELEEGKLKLEINGEAVVELAEFDLCYLAKTTKGFFIAPNADGRYELRVWMQKPKNGTSYFRIYSIIVV